MAPITRNDRTIIPSSGNVTRSQNFREGSWEFAGSEQYSDGSRANSEEPASYDGDEDEYEDEDRIQLDSQSSPALLEGPENNEDILHPLREAANRVGREVERFAEALDGFNPLKALDNEERVEMTFNLIDLYHSVAIETAEKLREQHFSDRRREDGAKWRKKMRGFKISQDPEVMDTDETDEPTSLLQTSRSSTSHDLERWEEEARTWDLLSRMVKIQNRSPTSTNSQHHDPEQTHRYTSERHLWNSFLNSDALGLERETVLTWLKHNADESAEDIDVLVQELQQNAERGDIVAHGWLHTKAAIKNQKRIHVWPNVLDPTSPDVEKVHLNSSRTEPLVTQLDPDAPGRQNRKLEAQDQYFERAIWLGCYEMLRRGKSAEDIREWCADRTEIWRAISMSGILDDSAGHPNSGGGTSSSPLWRRMCFALAKRGASDEYERAVYGVLSGDISTVEPVCRTWDDYLFAHYNALLRSQFENYLQARQPERALADGVQAFKTFDAVQFHGEPQTVGKRLVELLKDIAQTGSEVARPMKMLQGVIIAKQFDKYIYHQGLAISKLANAGGESILIPKFDINPENADLTTYIAINDYDCLRVVVHMLLALKNLGLEFGDSVQQMAVENVIVAYIGFLRLAGKEELIPLYASQLTGDRLYATLSRELVDVTDPDQRATQIRLMRELGLDVQKFVRFQTQFLFMDFPDKAEGYPADGKFCILDTDLPLDSIGRNIRSGFIGEDIDREDLLLIRSLEWHLLVEGLWSETFATGVLLYRRFFKNNKIAAARELARNISSSDISRSKTGALLGKTFDLASLELEGDDDDVTEQVDAPSGKRKLLKRHLLAEAKTFRDLELLIEVLDYLETGGNSIDNILSNPNEKARKESRLNLHRVLQPTKTCVKALLQDWLTSIQKEEPDFRLLREAYLPEIILAYDSILHFAGITLSRDNFLECMELSTIIAAAGSDLADMFVKKGRMAQLVEAFAENSKGLLRANNNSKNRTGTTSKKLRTLGWTRELWNIKV